MNGDRRSEQAGERDAALPALVEELRAREPIFHRGFVRTRADFDAMVAPDFWEVGASGRRYSREFVWETLAARLADPGYAARDRWQADGFEARRVAPDTVLLTYVLRQDDRVTRRLTVWRRAPAGWQILYHQGTLVAGPATDGGRPA